MSLKNHQRNLAKINQKRFIELYGFGLTDQKIAQELGLLRLTVLRYRKKMGLAPNVKIGQRGVSPPSPTRPYYKEVRRICNHEVLKALHIAATVFRQQGGCRETSYGATLTSPGEIPQARSFPYAPDPDKTTVDNIKWLIHFEQKVERATMVSVPGPAVFALAHAIKIKKTSAVPLLALEAVRQTKIINVDAPTSSIIKDGRWVPEAITTPSDRKVTLVMDIMNALTWTPNKETAQPALQFAGSM